MLFCQSLTGLNIIIKWYHNILHLLVEIYSEYPVALDGTFDNYPTKIILCKQDGKDVDFKRE
jgi:hypothetical protein